jgi:hypothetical protein
MDAPVSAEAPPWMPRSWRERVGGTYWLGRLIDKGRRRLASEAAATDLMNDYQFGRNNATDGIMLRLMGIRTSEVLQVLRDNADDEAAAAALLAKARWGGAQIRAWNAFLLVPYRPFCEMMDADEGRSRGPFAGVLAWTIRTFIQPPFQLLYRRLEARRK